MEKKEFKNGTLHFIANDGGLSFSVQKTNPRLLPEGSIPEEILFMVSSIVPEEDLTKDGELLLALSKDEAINLAKVLLEMVTE